MTIPWKWSRKALRIQSPDGYSISELILIHISYKGGIYSTL